MQAFTVIESDHFHILKTMNGKQLTSVRSFDALVAIAGVAGPIGNVHSLRALLKFVSMFESGGVTTRFAYVACAHSAAPLLPARVNFIACETVDPDHVNGVLPMRLRYIRRGAIRTEAELPFCRGVDVGMIAHFQLEGWADKLIADSSLDDPLESVRMCFLDYRDVCGDQFFVHGLRDPPLGKLA